MYRVFPQNYNIAINKNNKKMLAVISIKPSAIHDEVQLQAAWAGHP